MIPTNKVAFVFPGQGSQFVGMGKALYESVPAAREAFDAADAALGIGLSGLCFRGPDAELRATSNTQPAVLTHAVALLRAFGEQPDVVAGHSLGEYTAHVAAGTLSLEVAVALVRARGLFMEQGLAGEDAGMSAVSDCQPELVEQRCVAFGRDVEVANYNSPTQVVLAGRTAVLARLGDDLVRTGAKVTSLAVSAPFHSSWMEPAEARVAELLRATELSDPLLPVYTNVDAAPCRNRGYARDSLERQVSRPVRWRACVERMVRDGVGLFVEIGPRSVLGSMIAATAPRAKVMRVLQPKDFAAARSAIADARSAPRAGQLEID